MTVVCFSGGCDSTLALYEWAKASSEAYPVHALSIGHPQVPNQPQQAAARRRVVKELRRRGHHVRHTEVRTVKDVEEFEIEYVGFVQAQMWLGTAVQYLRKEEDLVLGYVRGDQIIHGKQDLFAAFDALQRLGNKTGKLNLYLEWREKHDVIESLRKAKLIDLVWYCSGNDSKAKVPCGTCQSCLTHRTATYRLDVLGAPKKAVKAKSKRG